MRTICYYILFLILFSACERESNIQLNNKPLDKVVIEAMLTNEHKAHVVKISKTVENINEKPISIIGAKVQIIEGSSTYDLTESAEVLGTYLTDTSFFAKPNKIYRLLVQIGNESYVASAFLATGAQSRSLNYSLDGSLNLYKIDWQFATYHPISPTMWEVNLDWSAIKPLDSNNTAKLYFYSLPNLDVSEVFAPASEIVYFPKGTIANIRRYALSDEYASYLRELLLETKWHGGYLDSQPANVPSNFSNGALGYFSVCAVVSGSQIIR